MPRVIDGRDLVPPQPFELTMAALDDLAPGDEIVLLLRCRPQPLYRVLQRNGYVWREEFADESFEIHIMHAAPAGR
jgi:hypothetical protein